MIDFFFIPITLPITIFCILNFMENCLETFKKYPPLTENLYLELAKSAMDEELIKNVLHRQTFVSLIMLIRIISLG